MYRTKVSGGSGGVVVRWLFWLCCVKVDAATSDLCHTWLRCANFYPSAVSLPKPRLSLRQPPGRPWLGQLNMLNNRLVFTIRLISTCSQSEHNCHQKRTSVSVMFTFCSLCCMGFHSVLRAMSHFLSGKVADAWGTQLKCQLVLCV